MINATSQTFTCWFTRFSRNYSGNYVYVDKTPHIYNLLLPGIQAFAAGPKYFLFRPRRFGKSLTLSTLKAIFSGQKELFQDLYIGQQTDYDFPTFPVLHFDFSEIGHQTSTELAKILKQHIEAYATQYGCSIQNSETLAESWGQLMGFFEKQNQRVVILIDEYDKPILDHITNLPIAKENRDILKSFYEIIKANDENLRFVFITGITKFSQMNIFSGMNNLTDISLDSNYATLCGYTQDELESYFSDYIDVFADHKKISKPALLGEIKKWYNGFRFTENPITLYNPFSTLTLLLSKKFQYHWFATGTPTYLMQLFQQLNVDVENIPHYITANDTASYDIDNFQVNLPALLFQTGYKTIVDVSESGLITLDYPNLEVREAFTQKLLQTLIAEPTSPEVTIITLRDALAQNNLDEVFRILTLFFAKIPYDIQEPTEKYYQSLFHLIFTIIGTRIRAEVRTHKGRIDALIETQSHLYLFEFKIVKRVSSAQKQALAAIAQIESNDYALPFQDCGKATVKIGVVFSIKDRNIAKWIAV